MSTTVTFNTPKVSARIKRDLVPVQKALDIQVLKDSNYFCPEKDGDLKTSGLQSVPGSGIVEWNKPYANKQYNDFKNKSLDKNPSARMKWFEAAKALHKKDWEKLANVKFDK